MPVEEDDSLVVLLRWRATAICTGRRSRLLRAAHLGETSEQEFWVRQCRKILAEGDLAWSPDAGVPATAKVVAVVVVVVVVVAGVVM
jgi:hypothetical protein